MEEITETSGLDQRYYGPAAAASDDGASQAAPRNAPAPEGATKNGDASSDAAFVHRLTDAHSRGDYTHLDDPRINGDPDAVVLASPTGPYERNIGMRHDPREKKWTIFNQDRAAVTAGSAFRAVVPPAGRGFVHRATPPNTVGNATYLDNPLVNGEPDAEVSVTRNWNPGGGNGVYNDHPVGVLYDEDAENWAVSNEDDSPMSEGVAFNVAVSGAPDPAS